MATGPSEHIVVAWAKAMPHGVREPEEWLPLWQHLDDAADIAGLLWDRWVSPSLRRLIGGAFPNKEEDGRRLLRFLAGTHDVGKATPAFAIQVPWLGDRMRAAGLAFGPTVLAQRTLLRHEVASAAAVDRWLSRWGLSKRRERDQFTDVLAGHHGSFPGSSAITEARAHIHLIGDAAWLSLQDALVERAARRSEVIDRIAMWRTVRLTQAVQMQLCGLVVMADWIASSDVFPLLERDAIPAPTSTGRAVSQRARLAWDALNFTNPWIPKVEPADADSRFRDRFPWATGGPRPVQRIAGEAAESMLCPGLMIIEAPMGVGKTEAGLMAAETLAARCGATGVFVALPTQATSNAMFTRVHDWLRRLPDPTGRGAQSVALVHGKAALNREYARLRWQARAPIYGETSSGRTSSGRTQATVNEWMTGRKRAALSDFVVGTIDQVLFAALRARHLMLRQLSLTSKVVIIDEVHAADVYMSTFLDSALRWLAAAGVPVVLMTATLPAERRQQLYAAYEEGARCLPGAGATKPVTATPAAAVLEGDIGYPVVITSTETGPAVIAAGTRASPTDVVLHRLPDDLETLGTLLQKRLADGGCAVVIRNTVRRAQETAEHLEDLFGGDDVTVAHAQFLACDRIENDERLMRLFGPEGGHRPFRHIVVATQVVEQSLDLDFDLMVTDVAPLDLILQRLGRLHRHRRGVDESDRPALLREPVCYVTGVRWESTPPRVDGGATSVYGAWPLLRTLAVLDDQLDGGRASLPADIAPLIQRAYADEPGPQGWDTALSSARRSDVDSCARRRKNAEAFALPEPRPKGDLYDLDRFSMGVVDEDAPQGQAAVRDGDPSIEVVVLQRSAEGVDRICDWVPDGGGDPLPLRHCEVPAAQARRLATCTVRLPAALSHGGVIDRVIGELEQTYFDGWQRSPFLSGQLALVLDDNATTELAGHVLRYDRRWGLRAERFGSPRKDGS